MSKNNTQPNWSRRDLLKAGALVGAGTMIPGAVGCATGQPRGKQSHDAPRPAEGEVRNIIFMVSDGMSMGVPSMAEPFSHMARGKGTHWYTLLHTPGITHGLLETASLNSVVTDSAAASSAWGSGTRVNNGVLNMLPDGREMKTITDYATEKGKRVGLVTTDSVCGATPAGFATVVDYRRKYDQVAAQYLDRVHVLMGGGRATFEGQHPDGGTTILDHFMKSPAGYRTVFDRNAVKKIDNADFILGLFADDTIPYTIDQINDKAIGNQTPTLAEMTSVALQSLDRGPNGFLLQVEAARVDHACHKNDAGAMLWDQLAFDDAVEVALDFVRNRTDTLLIITSDHGNSNPGVNGWGSGYSESSKQFQNLTKQNVSFERLVPKPPKGQKPQIITAAAIEKGFGIKMAEALLAKINNAVQENDFSIEIHEAQANGYGLLGQAINNHTAMGFCSMAHTNDHMLITAIGPHQEDFAGLRHHTDVFDLMCGYWNIKDTNPKQKLPPVVGLG